MGRRSRAHCREGIAQRCIGNLTMNAVQMACRHRQTGCQLLHVCKTLLTRYYTQQGGKQQDVEFPSPTAAVTMVRHPIEVKT